MYADTQITVNGVTYQVDASGVCREVIPEEQPKENSEESATDAPSAENAEAGSLPDGPGRLAGPGM